MPYSIYSSYKNKSNRLETRAFPLPVTDSFKIRLHLPRSNIAELIQTCPFFPIFPKRTKRIAIPTRRHPLVDILKMLPIRGIALFHESASQI